LSAKTAAADEARAMDWQRLVASQRPARKAGTDPEASYDLPESRHQMVKERPLVAAI
jgi:hypothetical protein